MVGGGNMANWQICTHEWNTDKKKLPESGQLSHYFS